MLAHTPSLRSCIAKYALQTTRVAYSARHHSTSSVNPNEVSHFRDLASEWWNPHGSSRLLHLMNPLRHEFISSCLSSQPEGPSAATMKLKYLDIGCGGGIFAESAARLSHTQSVTAIDPTPEVIAVAREHARQDPALIRTGRLEYLNTSIEQLPVPERESQKYDIVALWEVVEHIQYPAEFLKTCIPFVKPGGWIVLSTIARTWTSWFTTKLVAEDIARIVPRGTHTWEQYLNEKELRTFFQGQAGWAGPGAVKAMGCVYVPGLGWRFVPDGENYGNYFFGVRKDMAP